MCIVPRFFTVKNYSVLPFTENCTVYRPKVMIAGVFLDWVRFFKNDQTNINDEERSDRLSVITVELIEKIDRRVCENYQSLFVILIHYFQYFRLR